MRRSRRVVVVGLCCAVTLTACGGGGAQKEGGTGAGADGELDKTIQTALEAGLGERGKKEDAPGKVRFTNLLARDGKGIDVDVWWGQPDEGDKAATVRYGETTPETTPRRPKGFDSAVYSVTEVGKPTKSLWSWDRFSPDKDDRRLVLFSFAKDDGAFTETSFDYSPTKISPYDSKPQFPPAEGGRTRLRWAVVGEGIESGDDLLAVMTSGRCLTNGSGIAGPDRNQLQGESYLELAAGTPLALHANCEGPAVSPEVKVPPAGRAFLFAYLDASGKSQLLVVPLQG